MKLINYPAMASPASINFIDRYISERLTSDANIIDPFCGTGRLLYSPRKKGFNVTGIDCSPIAILIARVGHQGNNTNKLIENLNLIISKLNVSRTMFLPSEEERFWFSDHAYCELRRLLLIIDRHSLTINTRRFFWLALVNTIRIASYIREEEYKTHRMKPEKRLEHNPKTNEIFINSCMKIAERLSQKNATTGKYRLVQGDLSLINIPKRKYDALITSPPYGDSISTVGYGQFARIPLIILSYSEKFIQEFDVNLGKNSFDTYCLGGSNCDTPEKVELPAAVEYITKGPMKKFCIDYFHRLNILSTLLKQNSMCFFVLADRTYKSRQFPLIDSTIDHMKCLGFSLIDRHDRYLSHKRLPRSMQHINQNKIKGHSGMNYESVVVFLRQL